MRDEHISVAFACDDNFVPHLYSTINSIIVNKNVDDIIDFYILHDGLNKKNIKILNDINNENNCSVTLVKIDKNIFMDLPLTKECPHISIAMYYRYSLAELLPNLDKVIYLDSDLNVLTSLKALFNTDIADSYFGGVEDIFVQKNTERLGINKYCNSGVILINLKKWRAENIQEKLYKFTIENKDRLVYPDQDVLNTVLQEGIKYIDKKWNAQVGEYKVCYDTGFNELGKDAYIIHHIGQDKPWLLKSKSPFKGVYFKYLENTPFRNYKIKTYIIQFLEEILSVKKTSAHIILSVLGIKLSIRIGKK